MAKITEEMKALAHSIHHESIRIDQDERCGQDIDWVEEYFKVLVLACDLAHKVLDAEFQTRERTLDKSPK